MTAELWNLALKSPSTTIWLLPQYVEQRSDRASTSVLNVSRGWFVEGELYEVTSNSSEVQGSVKLVGGDTASAGRRVEILLGDQWTPICSQTTRVNAYIANIVCHQLGYAFGLSIFTQSRPSFQGLSVTGINCTGSEQRLEDCTGNRSLSRCYTRQLKVICSSEMTIRLNKNRLVLPNHAGWLEIFHDGHWNTACLNSGNMHHLASVVCTQLRFDQGRLLPPWSIADTRVLVSYVRYHVRVSGVHCSGTEKSLGQCVELAGDTTSCDPREQVGIQCLAYTRLKLQGGGSFSGRVMVEHNGTWGSICEDNTGPGFANVVCKELGFAEGGFVTSTNHGRFGYFNGQIWLDEVNCRSNARSLNECSLNNGWGVHDCSHSEDVGVICREPGRNYESIWLDGGLSGRVRMNYVNVSGTVCPSGDPDNIARVICRELGYSFIDNEPYAFLMPSSFNAWLYNVSCDGTERNLHECRNSDIVHHTQTCSKELYVHCISSMSSSAETGAVRLTGGLSPKAGRLEVFYNRQWGSVCDDGVTYNLARVVCSQLGYHTSYPSVMRSLDQEYNTADMPIWLDTVECRGLERYISECDHEPWGLHDCTHDEDVGIDCSTSNRSAPEETAAVRLTGGSSPKAGRLEVYHSHQWGSVCDDGVTYNLARVVCSQLGYHTSHPTLTPYHSNEYTTADMPIWLDSVLCRGLERHISECYHEPWGQHDCTHDEDVGIDCSDPEESDSSSTGSTSLVGILLGVFIPIGIITAVIIMCQCRKKRGETTQAGRHQQPREQFTPYQLRQMTSVAYASSSSDDAVRGNVSLGDTRTPVSSRRTPVSSNPPEYQSISFNRDIPLNSLSHNGRTNNGYLSESSHAQEHYATDLTETPELPSYEDAMSNPDVFKIHM